MIGGDVGGYIISPEKKEKKSNISALQHGN